jgi:hypothetical protein
MVLFQFLLCPDGNSILSICSISGTLLPLNRPMNLSLYSSLASIVRMSLPFLEFNVPCLVVGGGPSGFGAASAALRGGCETILVERHGFLGGMGTAAGLSCYLNHLGVDVDLSTPVYRSFKQQQSDLKSHYHDAHTQADYFEPECCKLGMEQAILNAGGKLLYHSTLSDVYREDGSWVAEFMSKGARVRIRCHYLIDATGDADPSAMAGASLSHGLKSSGQTQPMTMVVQMGGFDPKAWAASGRRLIEGRYVAEGDQYAEQVLEARSAREWSIPRENIALFWSMPNDPSRITVNGTRISGFSSCNPMETTCAEVEGRRQAQELVAFFKKYISGFENVYLHQTGPQIGVRESRRIVGRYTLTEDDVRSGRIPESSVMLCAYPIDVHSSEDTGTQYEDNASVYGIPWECQLPIGLENIAAAGRCISATHEAAGSFRVMPTCMGLGEAAGTAVALAWKNKDPLHSIDGSAIRREIDAAHAVAGNQIPSEHFKFNDDLLAQAIND